MGLKKPGQGYSVFGLDRKANALDRLYQFQKVASKAGQSEILDAVRKQYPGNTRFVVLPMDMSQIGHGNAQVNLKNQHDELAQMAATTKYSSIVLPFATLIPGASERVIEARRAIEDLGFSGLKLYPRLGFAPNDPDLMQHIYPMLSERNLPVMSHCSRGGVQGRKTSDEMADIYTKPEAFRPVMDAFPDLRICLAHFGGVQDWNAYANTGFDPDDLEGKMKNWQVQIRKMIASGNWPGLWTGISYTMFHFEDNILFLRLFMRGDGAEARALQRRVLFGSDFYMTRQEVLSERAVCFRLRNQLGEALFRRIAQVNPEVWLGEVPEDKA